MIDVFEEAKARLTMQDVAQHYSFTPNRAGFIRCPFHTGDRTASLKIYPGRHGFHCFACNRGGSVIDFTAELFSLNPLDAVKKLNTDFGLCLPLDRREPTQEERRQAQRRREISDTYRLFEEWRDNMIRQLNNCFYTAHMALKSIETPADLDRLTNAQALAIREQARVEYYADLLSTGTMEDMMAIFRERGRIGQLCNRILSNTQTKSSVA